MENQKQQDPVREISPLQDTLSQYPPEALLRLPQIIGQTEVTPEQAAENRQHGKGPRKPRPEIPTIIPVSRSTWWQGVRDGRFPRPIKLGRASAWRAREIRALAENGVA